jgi:hypothetical protein
MPHNANSRSGHSRRRIEACGAGSSYCSWIDPVVDRSTTGLNSDITDGRSMDGEQLRGPGCFQPLGETFIRPCVVEPDWKKAKETTDRTASAMEQTRTDRKRPKCSEKMPTPITGTTRPK